MDGEVAPILLCLLPCESYTTLSSMVENSLFFFSGLDSQMENPDGKPAKGAPSALPRGAVSPDTSSSLD